MKKFVLTTIFVWCVFPSYAQFTMRIEGFSDEYKQRITDYGKTFLTELHKKTSITNGALLFSYEGQGVININIPYSTNLIEHTQIFGYIDAIHSRDLMVVISLLHDYRMHIASDDGFMYKKAILNLPIVVNLYRDPENYVTFYTYTTTYRGWPITKLNRFVRVISNNKMYTVQLLPEAAESGYLATTENPIDEINGERTSAYYFHHFFAKTAEEIAAERLAELEAKRQAELAKEQELIRRDSILNIYTTKYDSGEIFSLKGGAEWGRSSQLDSLNNFIYNQVVDFYTNHQPSHGDWITSTLSIVKNGKELDTRLEFDTNNNELQGHLVKTQPPKFTPITLYPENLPGTHIFVPTRDSVRLNIIPQNLFALEIKEIENRKMVIYKSNIGEAFSEDKFINRLDKMDYDTNSTPRYCLCYSYTITDFENNELGTEFSIKIVEKPVFKHIIKEKKLIK